MDASYPPPVDQLLTHGDTNLHEWPEYRELGISEEHVPDLIRMATDEELIRSEDDDDPTIWAPVHAWRALGQLRAEAAIEPLITLFPQSDDNDYVAEELPDVFAMIGPAAIPALSRYLQDRSQEHWPRVTASNSLKKIAKSHAEARDAVVAALVEQLDRHTEEEPHFNAFPLSALLDLKAAEAAPAIERAFAADSVDESISGDWEDAQVALGLLEERVTPRPRYDHFASMRPAEELEPPAALPVRSPQAAKKKAQTKAKKKMARQSRKQNRKRK